MLEFKRAYGYCRPHATQSAVKTPLGRIIAASILFAGGIFIVMAVGSIYSIHQLSVAAAWVSHTEEVKTQLNRVLVNVADLESGARNYVITGDESFLATHSAAKEQLGPALNKLRELVADNAEQTRAWAKLKALADRRVESSTAMVAARREQGLAAAAELAGAKETQQISAELRGVITAMLTTEDGLLTQRRLESDQETNQSVAAAVATSAVGLGVLAVAGWVLGRQFRARRQAEEHLAKSRSDLQSILDNSPMGIFLKDLDGRYIILNNRMAPLLGKQPEECVGRLPTELFPPERVALIRQEDADLLAAGAMREIDLELECADGVRRTFRTIKFPLRDERGRIYAVGGISSDITERNRMEKALQHALSSAEAASRTKSQFLANMSHELRTPLNSVIGFSEILLDKLFGELNVKQQQYVTNILGSGRHLLLLINDLLDLAKIEAGKMHLDPERVMVEAVVQDGVNLVRGMAERKGVRLEVVEVDASLVARLDASRVKQIIYNLMSNAVKFTPKGGRVMLTAERFRQAEAAEGADGRVAGEWLRLTVLDSGIGIAAEDLERIFMEFEQVDSTYARQQEGTGLGLALTRKLVSLHGGRVWAESPGRINQGSKFQVLLPLLGPPTTAERTAAPARPAAMGDEVAAAPLRPRARAGVNGRPVVLVVEDDVHACQMMKEHLDQGGYDMAQVATGEEALRQAVALRPVAITLDILLPDIHGLDVLARLKANRATANIPVLIVSVTDDRQLGMSLGAAEYFVKPVSAEKLLDALARARETSKGEIRDVLVVDDEAASRENVKAVLEPRGYRVRASASGEEALRLIAEDPPDVAIVDLTMPGMSGFELVTRLRQNPATRKLPICIYTAKDLSASEVNWLNGQATAITPKPFREQLLGELQRVGANSV